MRTLYSNNSSWRYVPETVEHKKWENIIKLTRYSRYIQIKYIESYINADKLAEEVISQAIQVKDNLRGQRNMFTNIDSNLTNMRSKYSFCYCY